jgi:Ni,Fe-hydrogenase maturation factor
MKLYVFGNPLVKEDSLPLGMIEELKKEFPEIEFLGYDEFQLDTPRNINILDSAKGIDDVILIDDLDKIKLDRIQSLHDFDIAHELKLLKKLGRLDEIKILALPQGIKKEEAIGKLVPLIKSIQPEENA